MKKIIKIMLAIIFILCFIPLSLGLLTLIIGDAFIDGFIIGWYLDVVFACMGGTLLLIAYLLDEL